MITDLTLGENIFNSPDLSIKMKILHAVNKSLDQITVAEICRNAGISRQTFYRHFESKYDIPWWHSIFCRQFYLNEIGRTIDWKTGYYHHLRLIAQERDFFRESIQYSINTPFGQTIMPENRKAVASRHLGELPPCRGERQPALHRGGVLEAGMRGHERLVPLR